MKKLSFIKTLLAGAAVLTIAVSFTSCKKNDVDESGSVNLKIVNASPSSSAQSFYLANNVVVQGGLNFGDTKGYIAANSGNNLEAQFRNEGSSTAFATGKFNFNNGSSYIVFLAGDGQSARVKLFPDDLSPVEGKAKVRFVHLSDAAPANIDIRKASGDNLIVNLAHDNASNYVSLDPGILSLQVFATGQSASLGNFDLSAFTAGKIYTVYITGSTTSTITVHQIAHN
jgi:hypothetical protein